MRNKKGTHVGIVLSFVIFVTFVLFFYLMIQPALKTESKQAVLDTLKENIIEMASAELTTASVFVETGPQDCANLEDFFDSGIENKIIVLDENKKDITAKKNSQDLYLDRESPDDNFFKVYGSEEFSAIEEGSISPCVKEDYEFGFVKNTTEIFETKILDIIERHEDDYQNLKNDLSMPPGSEFGLNFTYADGESVSTADSSARISIFAREFPVKYITDDAETELGILRIKVW